MLKRFEGRWGRIDELVIYFALALAFLAQILPNVIPATRQFLDGGGANAVIIFALAGMFRLMTTLRREMASPSAIKRVGLGDVIGSEMTNNAVFQNLDVFAHSTRAYSSLIEHTSARFGNVRILINSAPSYIGNEESDRGSLEDVVRKWNRLLANGRINSLNIRTYDFASAFHFMIADGRVAQFGLFDMRGSTGTGDFSTYTPNKQDPTGERLMKDLEMFFEIGFNDLSRELTGVREDKQD
ncbi:hypothetical protein ACFLV0_04115 [Chloroflexota bacterium]